MAHRFEEQSTVIEKRVARWHGGGTGEHRENIHAINFSIGRQRSASERGERRKHVDHGGDGIGRGAGGNLSGPPRETGDADAALECGALGAAEREIVRALADRTAVVGKEEDECVAIELHRAEGVEDLTDAPVDLLHPVSEEAVG